jgi:hypothetical protein
MIDDETDSESRYSALPTPVDLSQTVASVDASDTEVEHGDTSDWNQGADPYLRITGWKRP